MVVKAKASNTHFSFLSKAFLIGSLLAVGTLPGNAQTYNPGDWRSAANGTLATSGIWEQYNGSGWITVTGTPATSSAPAVHIRHQISSLGGTNLGSVTIESGTFTVDNTFTISQNLQVKQNAVLQINNALSFAAGANFKADTDGKVIVNHTYTSPATTLWAGVESFSAGSTFIIKSWSTNTALVPNTTAIASSTANNYTAYFGHIIFDLAQANNTNLIVLASGIMANLAHGNIEFVSGLATTTINMAPSGPATSGAKGNFTISSAFSGTVNLAGSGAQNFSIGGNYVQQSGTVNYTTSTSSSAAAITKISGEMQLLGGTVNMHAGSSSGSSSVQLAGNLMVANPAQLLNTNATAAAGASAPVSFVFVGTTAQTISVEPELTNIPLRVNAGATAKLTRNLKIDGSAMFSIVLNGGTLDFNGFNYYGTSTFRQDLGATLRITSPEGISETGPTGNVQSSVRAFNSGGIYHYTGSTSQITGTGLNPASGAKAIIIDNPTTVTLTRSVNISNSTSAGIDIRKGIFEGRADAYVVMPVTNSCYLKMSENTVYRFLAPASAMGTNQIFPQANGTYSLHATSTIEIAGDGPQKLRGTTKVFGNITFGGSGTKTLSGNVANIEGTVTIKQTAIVDAEANTLGKTATHFSMSGGRFRTSRTSGVQPAMGGDYNLTGGVVEFYGTSAAASQSLRGGKEYYSIDIAALEANTAASNVSLATGSVNVKGRFNVLSPAVFQIGGGSTYITGTGEFAMEPGSTLKYGNMYGISAQGCGTDAGCGNIRTSTRNFPSDASYGFIGTASMASGTGLPSSVKNLYLQKGTNLQTVQLSQPVTVTEQAVLEKGILVLGSTKLTLQGQLVSNPAGTLRGSATSELHLTGTDTLDALYFTPDYQQLGTLVLNRANGFIQLGTPLTISSSVSFINGKLKTATGTELIFADNATYSGIAPEDETPLSYVVGPVSKAGNDAFIFPVGSAIHYAPAAISAPATIADFFTAHYYDTNPQSAYGSYAEADAGSLSDTEYWRVDHMGTSKVQVSLAIGANRSTAETGTQASARVVYLDQAVEPNIWRTGTQTETQHGELPSNFVSSFQNHENGYFTLGFMYAPEYAVLPVVLLNFSASVTNQAVRLSWETASEKENAYFTIERSADGRVFTPVGKIDGHGTTDVRHHYTFTDNSPVTATVYYRLRQTDSNGAESFSATIEAKGNGSKREMFSVFPNPANHEVTLQISEAILSGTTAEITVLNAAGIKINHTRQKISGAEPFQMSLTGLPAGLYFVSILTEAGAYTLPFIKI